MKVLPLDSYPVLQTPKYWLLGIAACLIAIHLDVTWKTTESIDAVLLRALIWGAALSLSGKERKPLTLEAGIPALGVGLILILWSSLRSIAARNNTDILVITVSPFVSALGLCLLASGFKGLKQYWRELLMVFVSVIPAILIMTLVEKITGVNITTVASLLTAKFSGFVLWYLGFEVTRRGADLILPGGAVAIGGQCSGVNAMVLLLQIAFVVILMFPTTKVYKKLLVPVAAILVAFLVNSVRVGLMAYLVAFSNQEAFVYWHEGDGSQIFSTIAIVLFSWLCQLAFEQDEQEDNPEIEGSVNLEEQ